MQVFLHHTFRYLLLAAMSFGAVSCEWVKDDLPECPPTELRVGFKYDYHMMESCVFSKHVGALYVYAFDRNDEFLFLRTETDTALLGADGYEMVFTDLEPGRYKLVTVAFQKSCEEMYGCAGAKFRMPAMEPGDPIEKLEVALDRQKNTGDGLSYVVHENTPLDTLWMNRTQNVVETAFQKTTRTTVDLMRHTKNLTVSLRQLDDPENITYADYDISVVDDNGCVRHDCSLRRDGELLTYTPYAMWDTEYTDAAENRIHRAAHADLSLARIIYSQDWSQNAILSIRNRKTDTEVARINLPEILVTGRNAAERNYPEQEFLDREYDYRLDFFLKGDTWEYVEVRISVEDWCKRIDYVDL